MVAIVAGNGLGLLNTSLNTLNNPSLSGQNQQAGIGLAGNGNASAYVNVATGNLIVRALDESLSGNGTDINLFRTYNAQGDAQNSRWRWMGEKRVQLVGNAEEVGSYLIRSSGDGNEARYDWDDVDKVYRTTDGAGAHDTVELDAGAGRWLWRNSGTTVREYYDSTSGWITALRSDDEADVGHDYIFDGDRLIQVRDASNGINQMIVLNYDEQGRVSSVSTKGDAWADAQRQVYYHYDNDNRLSAVITDLTPEDNNIEDLNIFVTKYYYDGQSLRLSGIEQSDGIRVDFSYQLIDGEYKISNILDRAGSTAFRYHADHTEVITANGATWQYFHDSKQRLEEIRSTPVNGVVESLRFDYDDNDNVTFSHDGLGNTTAYIYDEHGNLTRETVVGSNTYRDLTYTGNNQLASEKFFNADNVLEQATYYIYDDKRRLRFTVSGEKRVEELRYNSLGQISERIVYADGGFDPDNLYPASYVQIVQLENWVNQVDLAQTQLSHFEYDYRGNLTRQIDFADVGPEGNGVLNDAATITEYVYSEHGELLQTIAVTGSNRDQKSVLQSNSYDGQGRLIATSGANGSTATSYGEGTISVINENSGLTSVSYYDTRGRLLNVSSFDANNLALSVGQHPSSNHLVQGVNKFIDESGQALTSWASTAHAESRFDFSASEGVTVDHLGTITKTASSGWNAGFESQQTLAAGADGFVSFTADANATRMFGLSDASQSADHFYATINFAIHTRSDGSIAVYENGVFIGNYGSHQQGDELAVVRYNGEIHYQKNGVTFYTSTQQSQNELRLDVSLETSNGQIRNLQGSFTDSPSANIDLRASQGIRADQDGTLIKVDSTPGWNAGFESLQTLAAGENGSVSFITTDNSIRMFGLSIANQGIDHHYTNIDYGFHTRSDGSLAVYENGVHRGDFGSHQEGDVLSVMRFGGQIYYQQNGQTLYQSTVASSDELRLDVSLASLGAQIVGLQGSFLALPSFELEFRASQGITAGLDGTLRNINPVAGWTAGFESEQTLAAGENGSVEFTADTYAIRMFGLSDAAQSADYHYTSIAYGFHTRSNGSLAVYENGNYIGDYGSHVLGDVLSVVRVDGVIYYQKNGQTVYTSLIPSNAELRLDTSLGHPGAEFSNVQGSFLNSSELSQLSLRAQRGVVIDSDQTITKLAGNNAWDSNIESHNTLASKQNGWVQITVLETGTDRIFGLNDARALALQEGFTEMDFAIRLDENNAIMVYESGNSVGGEFGDYQLGDVYRVARVDGQMQFSRNGEVFYTSQTTSASALRFEGSIYSNQGTLGKLQSSFAYPADNSGTTLRMRHLNNAQLLESSMTVRSISGDDAWGSAGFESDNILAAGDNGWLEVTASNTNTHRIIGFSSASKPASNLYQDIDYAILLGTASELVIFENGVEAAGTRGTYNQGDVFSIARIDGVVHYLRNGQVFYSSAYTSEQALRVDGEIYHHDATIDQLKVSFAVQPSAPDVLTEPFYTDNPGADPTEIAPLRFSDNLDVFVDANGELSKTNADTTAWDAGVRSSNVLAEGVDGWLQATVQQTDTRRMFGYSLAYGDEQGSSGNEDIDYAIYLDEQGEFHAYQDGVSVRNYGSYSAGDTFRLARVQTSIALLKNDQLFHTFDLAASSELRFDASFYSADAKLSDVMGSFFTTPTQALPLSFRDTTNVIVDSSGQVHKTSSVADWNAGVESENVIEAGANGWAEFTVVDFGHRTIGLSNAGNSPSASNNSIEFGLSMTGSGTIAIYEQGVHRGNFGSYSLGDVLRVERINGTIYYSKNGETFFHTLASSYDALRLDTSIHAVDATLANIQGSFFRSDYESAPLAFRDITNVSVDAYGQIHKTSSADDWNAGVESENVMAAGTDGWAEFTVLDFGHRTLGLSRASNSASANNNSIDFGLSMTGSGSIAIYEQGAHRGNFGNYDIGDVLRVELIGGSIVYKKNGQIIYQSQVTSYETLRLDTSLHAVDATFANLQGSFFRSGTADTPLTFRDTTNVTIDSNGQVHKTSTTADWNAGVESDNLIAAGADGWAEFTVMDLGHRTLGLTRASNGPSANNNSIEFGLSMTGSGDIAIYEQGVHRGNYGNYSIGDVLRVERIGDSIYYKKNGVVLAPPTSAHRDALRLDTSIHAPDATLANLQGSFFSAYSGAEPLTFRDTTNVSIAADGQVHKTSTVADWNAGIESENVIEAGADGWAQFTVVDFGHRTLGLSRAGKHISANNNSIDFGLSMTGSGTIAIYEQGVHRGNFGRYALGDVLRVERIGEQIFYKKNGVTIATGTSSGGEALRLDTSIHAPNATFANLSGSFFAPSQTVTEAFRFDSVLAGNDDSVRSTYFVYDEAGRLRMTENAAGEREFIFYDAAGRVNQKIDVSGLLTEYKHDAKGNVIEERQLLHIVDTSDLFNGSHVIQTSVSANTHEYDRVTSYHYDSHGRLASSIERQAGDDLETQYFYDSASRLIRTLERSDPDALSVHDRSSRIYYDQQGLIEGELDAEGYLTAYSYDGAGRLVEKTRYSQQIAESAAVAALYPDAVYVSNSHDYTAVSNAVEHSDSLKSHHFYDAQGRLTGEVDELGYLTKTVYLTASNTVLSHRYLDPVVVTGTQTLADIEAQAGAALTTTRVFDRYGRETSVESPDGTINRTYYDDAGRITLTVSAFGTNEARVAHSQFNAFGDVTAVLAGEGLNQGLNMQQAIDQYGTRFDYDRLGRQIAEYGPDGQKTLRYFDSEGNLSHTVNGLGQVTQYRYNHFAELTETRVLNARIDTTGLFGGALTDTLLARVNNVLDYEQDRIISRSYNQLGQMTIVVGPESITTNTYSVFGELETTASTDRGVQTFVRDKLGRALQVHQDYVNSNGENARVTRTTSYDGFGRVEYTEDENGHRTTTTYSSDARTITIRDATNSSRVNVIDAYGRVVESRDGRNQITNFNYDDLNRQLTVTTPDSTTVTVFNRHGEDASITDDNGNTLSFEYNRDGNLRFVRDEIGESENRYDDSGRLTDVFNKNGHHIQYRYDEADRRFEEIVDPDGLNLITRYEFDSFGNTAAIVEAYGTDQARRTQHFYDTAGRVTRTIVNDQEQTQFFYNGAGQIERLERGSVQFNRQQVTEYSYDLLGRRTSEIIDPDNLNIRTEFRYDAVGNLTKTIDADGKVSWFTYDDANRPKLSINAEGEVTENFYDANGQLQHVRQYHSRSTDSALSSDDDTLPETYSKPWLNFSDRNIHWVYDGDGRQRFVITGLNNAEYQVVENIYDGVGNVIESRVFDQGLAAARLSAIASGEITEEEIITELEAMGYGFDNWGSANILLQGAQQTRFVYDSINRLRYTLEADGSIEENIYDALGNVIEHVKYAEFLPNIGGELNEADVEAAIDRNPSDIHTYFVYDEANRNTFTINGEGEVSKTNYNELGQVVQTTFYAQAITADISEASSRSHDALITLMSAQENNPSNRTTHFFYDGAGRQTYTVNGLGQVSGNIYNKLGQLITTTQYYVPLTDISDADHASLSSAYGNTRHDENLVTHFVYDSIGRQRFSIIGGREWIVSENVYDVDGNIKETRQFDALIPADSVYDEVPYGLSENRIINMLRNSTGNYSFANWGDASTNDGFSRRSFFAYDDEDRLRFSISNVNNSEWVVSEKLYDVHGNLIAEGIYEDKLSDASISPLLAGDHADPLDAEFIATELSSVNRRTSHYAYDLNNRLVYSVDGEGYVNQNVYDSFGNIIEQVSYFDAPELGGDYSLGNIANDVNSHEKDIHNYFIFDNNNRNTFVIDGEKGVTQTHYDALGQVIKVTRYAQALTQDISAPGDRTHTDMMGYVDANNDNNQVTRFAYDEAGRQILTMDALGNVTRQDYDSFGHLIKTTQYDQPELLDWSYLDTDRADWLYDESLDQGVVEFEGTGHFIYSVNTTGQSTSHDVLTWQMRYEESANVLVSVRTSEGQRFIEYRENGVPEDPFIIGVGEGTFASGEWLTFTRDISADLASISPDLELEEIYSIWVRGSDVVRLANVSLHNSIAEANTAQNIEPGGRETNIVYDNIGRQRFIIDGENNISEIRYDNRGNVMQEIAYAGATSLSSYDEASLMTAVSNIADADNDRITEYVHDNLGRRIYTIRSNEQLFGTSYNAFGEVESEFQYDLNFSHVGVNSDGVRNRSLLDALVNFHNLGSDQVKGEAYIYDQRGLVSEMHDGEGYEVYTYDAFGNRETFSNKKRDVWTYEYDHRNQLTREISPEIEIHTSSTAEAISRQVVTDIEYDAFGNVLARIEGILLNRENGSTDDSQARRTEYEYDALNRQIETRDPGYYNVVTGQFEQAQATGAIKRYSRVVYDTLGNAIANHVLVGQGEFVSLYKTYDKLGRVIYEVDAENYVTEYGYNAFGEQNTLTRYAQAISLDPASDHNVTVSHSVVGNGVGNGSADDRTIVTEYDQLGRKTKVIQDAVETYSNLNGPHRDNDGNLQTEMLSPETQFEYDAFGNVIFTHVRVGIGGGDSSDPTANPDDWNTTRHYFDTLGRERLSIDGLGYATQTEYKIHGNVGRVTEYALSTLDSVPGAETESVMGQELAISDKDRITSFEYDKLNRQTIIRRHNYAYHSWNEANDEFDSELFVRGGEGKIISDTRYDVLGNIVQSTDAAENHITYDYNSLGFVEKVTLPQRNTVAKHYAGSGDDVINPFDDGALISVAPEVHYMLNGFGEIVREVHDSLDAMGQPKTIRRHYDLIGNEIQTVDPENNILDRKFDIAGRVKEELSIVSLEEDPANQSSRLKMNFNDFFYTTRLAAEAVADGVPVEAQTVTVTYRSGGEHITKNWQFYYVADSRIERFFVEGVNSDFDYDEATAGASGVDPQLAFYNSDVGEVFVTYDYVEEGQNPPDQELRKQYFYDNAGNQVAVLSFHIERNEQNEEHFNLLVASGEVFKYNAFGEVYEKRFLTKQVDDETNPAVDLNTSDIETGVLLEQIVFDKAGRTTSRTAADGETSYYFDLAGNSTIQAQLGNEGNEDDRIIEWVRDLGGRAIEERLPEFYGYNDAETIASNSSETLAERYSANTTLLSPLNIREYDRWGNVTSLKNVTSQQDASGPVTHFQYNQSNQLISERTLVSVADVLLSTNENIHERIVERNHRLYYDILGRVIGEADFVGEADSSDKIEETRKTRVYDSVGNILREVDSDGNLKQYRYDVFGNRIGEMDGVGTVRVKTFDRSNNLTSINLYRPPAGEEGSPSLTLLSRYLYDEAGRRFLETDFESDSDDVGGTRRYSYDERGNIVQTINEEGIQMDFVFDRFGNKVREENALGDYKTWSYYGGTRSRMVHEFRDFDGETTSYRYTAFGELEAEDAGDGEVKTYNYYNNGLVKDITQYYDSSFEPINIFGGTGPNLSGLTGRSYQRQHHRYDIRGLKVVEETYSGFDNPLIEEKSIQTKYSDYDAQGQLVRFESPRIEPREGVNLVRAELQYMRYSYDARGNRIYVGASYSRPHSEQVNNSHAWYRYDSNNRVIIEAGVLNSETNEVELDKAGGENASLSTEYLYDNAGRVHLETKVSGVNTMEVIIEEDYLVSLASQSHSSHDLEYTFMRENGEWVTFNYNANDSQIGGVIVGHDLIAQGAHEIRLTVAPVVNGSTVQLYQYHRYTYDEFGNQISHERAEGPSVVNAGYYRTLTTSEYNLRGYRTSRTTSLQSTATYYGKDGRTLYQVVAGIPGVNAVSSEATITSYGYTLENGQLFKLEEGSVDAAGNTIDVNSYDAAGRLITFQVETRSPIGEGALYRYIDTYRNNYTVEGGQYLIEEEALHVANAASTQSIREGSVTTYYYNRMGLADRIVVGGETEGGFAPPGGTKYFSYDFDGRIIHRRHDFAQDQSQTSYFYQNNNYIGSIGTDEVDLLPLVHSKASANPSRYTVSPGESLFDIAKSVYGDGSLWYLIADANGLNFGPTDTFQSTDAGRLLTIPKQLGNIENKANNFRPYNPGEIIGDTTPSAIIPPPPKQSCNTFGMVVMVVITIVVTYMTWGIATPALTTAATPGLTATVIGAGVSAYAGSLVGQSAGVLTGVQDRVDAKQALVSGVTAAITAGIGYGLDSLGSSSASLETSGSALASGGGAETVISRELAKFGNAAIKAATSVATNALVRNVVGLDSGFSWRSIAIQALGNYLNTSVVPRVGKALSFGNEFAETAINRFVGGAINANLEKAFNRGGKVDYARIAADAFGNALVGSIVRGMNSTSNSDAVNRTIDEQQTESEESIQDKISQSVTLEGLRQAAIDAGTLEYFSDDLVLMPTTHSNGGDLDSSSGLEIVMVKSPVSNHRTSMSENLRRKLLDLKSLPSVELGNNNDRMINHALNDVNMLEILSDDVPPIVLAAVLQQLSEGDQDNPFVDAALRARGARVADVNNGPLDFTDPFVLQEMDEEQRRETIKSELTSISPEEQLAAVRLGLARRAMDTIDRFFMPDIGSVENGGQSLAMSMVEDLSLHTALFNRVDGNPVHPLTNRILSPKEIQEAKFALFMELTPIGLVGDLAKGIKVLAKGASSAFKNATADLVSSLGDSSSKAFDNVIVELEHNASSGAILAITRNRTTSAIGNDANDMAMVRLELNVPKVGGDVDDIVRGFAAGNPGGLNFLNMSDEAFEKAMSIPGQTFFDAVNSKWVDAAAMRRDVVIVMSDRRFIYNSDGKLSHFGMEVNRFINVHNYRWNNDFTRLLPPPN